jgi:hypothetical protein
MNRKETIKKATRKEEAYIRDIGRRSALDMVKEGRAEVLRLMGYDLAKLPQNPAQKTGNHDFIPDRCDGTSCDDAVLMGGR